MKADAFYQSSMPAARARAAGVPRAARLTLELLARLETGRLTLFAPDGRVHEFGRGAPAATIRLMDWDVCAAAMKRGDIGFAQAWIDGRWQTDSLVDVLSLLVANRTAIESAIYGSALGRLAYRLRHLLNRNSRAGSRRNIHAHYDLGNAFYRLWLDPGMTYSSALFDGDPTLSLEHAQANKYARALRELGVEPGASVLEIGCGWGGLAELAAREGLDIVGLTLSAEQLRHAGARLRAIDGGDRARFVLRDYRDSEGQYDGIVSIEMFEAVGLEYWDDYFAALRRNLKPGARALVQTITIADALFDRYRVGTDFIQQYIFPGGMLASPSQFERRAAHHGLRVVNRLAFGGDYARTLALWRERFMTSLPEINALGFDARFVRTWEFYLAYCEAAFINGNTDVIQFTLEKQA